VRKLILQCGLSPGDIVMLTAAVRDLHRHYPGQFVTDVRTGCPALWEHNPHLTPLSDDDPEAELLRCGYPLINRCNEAPYHCLHGFIEFLNQRLGLAIKPTAYQGDIHLSAQEKAWYSQVREITGQDTPFWIVAAGGKYDVTIKWWTPSRYQEVVNHFAGRILFVQVGKSGHQHPRLEGALDLRGRTSLRQLVRLVYHAQGALCSVTALMHLAAAVPAKPGQPRRRPCVVIAGGREPAHWEAYPGHQFIHTNGALACCSHGGCWRDRTFRLRDGDRRDRPGNLCVDAVGPLPRCLDLISPAEVIRRIELYFRGGTLHYLSPRQQAGAKLGISRTADNRFDQGPLNLHNAGLAGDEFVQRLPPYPAGYAGKGIILCVGGRRSPARAWENIVKLRRAGCTLPIQIWHLGRGDLDGRMQARLQPLDVRCVNASRLRKRFPIRRLGLWQLRAYAILFSEFQEVFCPEIEHLPEVDPEFLFGLPQYRREGAVFWPGQGRPQRPNGRIICRSIGVRRPRAEESEVQQLLVDKQRCWAPLRFALWLNEHSDFFYRYLHGDRETFPLAFRKLKKSYALLPMRRSEGARRGLSPAWVVPARATANNRNGKPPQRLRVERIHGRSETAPDSPNRPGKVLLSLTTTSRRISLLPRVLETLCRQTRPADEIHLFLSREPYLLDEGVKQIPDALARIIAENKIQVSYVKNTGPYRKLLPLLRRVWKTNATIITVDDDTFYPPDFLQRLLRAYERHSCIVAFSGKKVAWDASGRLRPYSRWPRRFSAESNDIINFPIGKDGVLYRPEFFTERIFDSKALTLAPYADDVWFRCHSWREMMPACILGTGKGLFPQVEGGSPGLLEAWNCRRNDPQLQAVARYLDIQFLRQPR
jgi:ADP-heptose:LPS heptosyltransferase